MTDSAGVSRGKNISAYVTKDGSTIRELMHPDQTIAQQHIHEHEAKDHSEVCSVCVLADSPATAVAASPFALEQPFDGLKVDAEVLSAYGFSAVAYHPRAPPRA